MGEKVGELYESQEGVLRVTKVVNMKISHPLPPKNFKMFY